jgi:hypothetical protein
VAGARLAALAARPSSAAERWLGHSLGIRIDRNPLAGWSIRLSIATFDGAFLFCFWLMFVFYFAAIHTSPFIYFQF